MTLTNGMSIRDLIDAGLYDKDISEPTPLEQKKVLVDEVKTELAEDLLAREFNLKTIHLAWELAEDVNGKDEALNSSFLHDVVNYIDILEEFYKERSNEM